MEVGQQVDWRHAKVAADSAKARSFGKIDRPVLPAKLDTPSHIRQTLPMPLPDLENERFAHLVRVLERQFRRALERQLEVHSVPFGHWIFLRILWEEEGLSQRELATRSGLTTPTVHTAISKMEASGMVQKIVPKENTSRALVHLTDRGRGLRDVLEPLAVSTNAAAASGIPQENQDMVRETLLRMISNLERLN